MLKGSVLVLLGMGSVLGKGSVLNLWGESNNFLKTFFN